MPFTLGMTTLWWLLALLLGGIIGWLIHNLTCKGKASTTVSTAESEEVTRLKGRVANLEPVVAERDKLKLRLAEVEGDLKACMSAKATLESAPKAAAFAGIAQGDHDIVVADRDRLHSLVGAHETTIGDLRSQIAGLQSSLDAKPTSLAAGLAAPSAGIAASAVVDAKPAGLAAPAAPAAGLAAPMAFAATAPALSAADLQRAASVFGKPIKLDDLKIVEGIGPVFEGVFNRAGIETWAQLADTAPERLKELLLAHDQRNRMQNTSTWPDQSRLAALGKFAELKAMQDDLTAGRS